LAALTDDGTSNLFVCPALAYVCQQPVFIVGIGTFSVVSGFSDLGFDLAVGRSWDFLLGAGRLSTGHLHH
jgi:hypothetical protein